MNKVKPKKQQRIGLLEAKCRERGLPVTIQRRVIFDALLGRDDHPTIDQIYEDVRDRIPGVSRTTVYRTLETLAALGVAKKTSHVDAVARFDGNVEHHHHLVCVRCAKVVDFDDPALSSVALPDARRTGFDIVDFSVYLEGVCRECKSKEGNAAARTRRQKRTIGKCN
jgi:Fur family peroxide stress response transcriptional regulator